MEGMWENLELRKEAMQGLERVKSGRAREAVVR